MKYQQANLMSCSCSSPSARRTIHAVHYMIAEKWLKEAEFKPWLKMDPKDGLLEKMWCSTYTLSKSRINRSCNQSFIDGITDPSFLLAAIQTYNPIENVPSLMTWPW